MKPLIVIPARGGSKGIPGKNHKLLCGKPLVQYSIEAAMSCFDSKHIYLSTDSDEIAHVAKDCGLEVPFLRPHHLATDTASTYDVLIHALDFAASTGYEPDTLIVLQPTSPFRKAFHIREALALFHPELDMVVSVKETKSNPYYVLFEENDKGYLKKCKEHSALRRQDLPKVWEYNGAVYVMNVKTLRQMPVNQFEKVIKYEMDEMSSLDLDTPLDWKIAEYIAQETNYWNA